MKNCLHCQHGDWKEAQFNPAQKQAYMMRCRLEKWRYIRVDFGCQNGKFRAVDADKLAARIEFVKRYAPEIHTRQTT